MDIKDTDIEILKANFHKLRFICGVALYCDETASERRVKINPKLKYNNNFSIVTQSGKFLIDTQRFTMNRFYHKVRVTGYGLFEMILEAKDLSGYSWQKKDDKAIYINYIFDFKGNFLRVDDFEKILLILSNRTRCYSMEDYYKLPDYFKNVRSDVPWDCTQNDGLTPYTDEYRSAGRDHETTTYNIKDKNDNSVYFEDFCKGISMLNNGRTYIGELIKEFAQQSLSS